MTKALPTEQIYKSGIFISVLKELHKSRHSNFNLQFVALKRSCDFSTASLPPHHFSLNSSAAVDANC